MADEVVLWHCAKHQNSVDNTCCIYIVLSLRKSYYFIFVDQTTILKKNTILFFVIIFLHLISIAQKKTYKPAAFTRCYTMEMLQKFLHNPEAVANANKYAINNGRQPKNGNGYRPTSVSDTVNVPVIFHIVLPNPYIVSDAVIQSQIHQLNTDYAGLNADSTNGTPFYHVRGHSTQIRFILARRTPAGILSNGIDRVTSSTGSNVNLAEDPIKRTALGGADVWDPSSYLNFWVGIDQSGIGLLGYSQFPGTGIDADDGIFCNFQSIGISNCNIDVYNKGRTLVHEVGHYFGLFHIWGDEDACTGDDFRPLSAEGSTVVLPDSLANNNNQGNTPDDIGDTPNQAGSTTDCPSGIKTDACTSSDPGVMYQDYMDYTEDDCYSMFTKKQVARMEWILDNVRTGLKTSLGGTYPVGAVTIDALPYQSVNPGGTDVDGCSSISYPSFLNCPGAIVPQVRIKNNGTSPLTSLSVGLLVNGVAQTPVSFTFPAPGLPSGGTKVVSFPILSSAVGVYNLKFYTFNANGIPVDMAPANDTLTTTLTISAGTALPVFEGFENPLFPPAGWSLYNPDGDASWVRVSPGSHSASSMEIDNFSVDNTGKVDELRTPKFLLATSDSVIMTFDLAHKNLPGSNDELQVLLSNDCSDNWTSVFDKSGSGLATAGSSTAAYISPADGDWKNQKIVIGGNLISGGKILIAIRNTGDFGNNIFIDNINIYQQKARDLSPTVIVSPATVECSSAIGAPQVTISNNGKEAVTAFKVGYILNGATAVYQNFAQTIGPGTAATITLNPLLAASGSNNITLFTAEPISASGTGDQEPSNDTLTYTFNVATVLPAPLTEGFERPAFPPLNWQIINPDGLNTWVRKSPGNNSAFSAFIDNFSNDFTGEKDALKSPAVDVTGADSIIVSFDLAHKYFTGSSDELKVNVSTDCGNTFSTIFDKSGESLATAGESDNAYTRPAPEDWKNKRIALGGSYLSSGNIIAEFENTADFGNNIFIDNVNIYKLFKRDLQLVALVQPASSLCSIGPIAPVITVKNAGIDTITAFNISYSIDNGALTTTTVTGISLTANQQMNITLAAFSSSIGSHTFNVFSFKVTSVTGTTDQNTANDTLNIPFVIIGTQSTLPLTEGFEGPVFPPVNWGLINPDGLTTWQKTTATAKSGVGALEINNFSYMDSATNTIDKLISPVISNSSKNDSVFASFDLAYRQGAIYPGSTVFPLDTLEVQVTKDCGATFQAVWKKWGENLQTVSDPNYPSVVSFVPVASDWKNINIYLSPFTGSDNFQVYFVAKSNKQNNIWIDNINVYAKILPQKLKDQGYLIYPNPFKNTFLIHHYRVPVDLQAAQVFNSSGQLVWEKFYNGSGTTEMTVDLSNKAKGVYILKMTYTNRTVQAKIIKD